MKKILLVPGHSLNGDRGMNTNHGMSENEYAILTALYMKRKYPAYYDVYIHHISSYGSRQNALAKYANGLDYRAVVEIHTNASEKHTAQGTEGVVYKTSSGGTKLCNLLTKEISDEFKIKERAIIRAYSDKDRGYGFVSKMKAPAVLIELGFADENKFKEFVPERVGNALHKGMIKF